MKNGQRHVNLAAVPEEGAEECRWPPEAGKVEEVNSLVLPPEWSSALPVPRVLPNETYVRILQNCKIKNLYL